jgi:hypothetical protein
MTIDLSEVTFNYDFFSLPLPDGNTLIMNLIDEDFLTDKEEVMIKGVNILVALEDGSANVLCSSVIGMKGTYFTIKTGYPEYEGKTLTSDNMKYCTMEITENE